ncbi:exodeoxyribonuclease V subunit gamma [Microlunatus flavus]|uniref:RecBCD enzyme subunit RecC n=1 Tax=Microlunatus flavus TaxID=1036181 RepID=A0A1H9I2M5_9ACTN|nr:exodeoxyribonuclease V subunit gamma [Microlunatus flavus]SEQ68787.1 DNA helicase/exodeoxyribonuclease V, gamma subunit [Microlunatus flavus]
MSLHLHRAERADVLVDALGEVLAAPLADPFATEVVCVPTPGVERWIAQRLAHHLGATSGDDGVCAGVDFPSPARFVADVLGRSGSDDPWVPSRAVWPLLAVLETAVAEPWAAVLADHLGPAVEADAGPGDAEDTRRSRRWSTARRLAGLFARYAADRPSMLEAWAAGRDLGPDLEPLAADRAWQPELWRRLRDHIGGADPVARLRADVDRLRSGEATGSGPLPERLSVFGATRLDPRHLDMLLALAATRDVHLWLPHPSPAAWERVAREPVPTGPLLPLRADVAAGEVSTNPLLTYLGRDLRELQVRLGAGAARAGVPTTDARHPAPAQARAGDRGTLLGRLQADLAADRPPAGDHLLDAEDRSVQVHACAGPHRQVEVLREVLLGLLADDETLQPRDVVVMCPDVEAYAPLVAATFGLDADEDGAGRAEHPGHRLRVRLADRSLRQLNPVLATVGRLLDLADARVTLSALLDLAAAEPVATRFRLGEDDLERLHELLPQTGVRWGLDAAHRARFGMAGFAQNTWAAGLDRLLLGVAMDESDARFIGTVLPLDDVASDDVGLVGRLAELLGRVRGLSDGCATPKTLPDWLNLCREVVEQLTDVRPADRWQHTHAYGELARLEERAGDAALQSTLSLTEVRALLADAFRGRAGRANFRTGTLTVASLLPMRAVPHRVVCLLGMDDGAFPRRATPDGDDLTAAVRRVGDPDPRGEDRQLFLDAVCSAEETLVVLHSAVDPRNGTPLRPAVPVEALLETLDATARTLDGRPVRAHLTVPHALQPFGPANFTVEAGATRPEPFSFDRAALRGARAGRAQKVPAPQPYADVLLDPLPPDRAVELTELYRFFQHPVRALLRARAGLADGGRDEGEDEQIPVELDGLQRWAIGERMLQAHLRGADLDVLAAAEWRRGSVPPRELGARVVGDLRAEVGTVAAAATTWTSTPAERVDLVVDLDRVRVAGSVDGVRGDAVVRVLFSRPSARHRLQAWVELLALSASRPEREWRGVVIGRKEQFELGPVTPEFARLVLADLVDLQGTGLRTLIPFAPLAAYEYARQESRDPQKDDRKRLEEAWGRDRDALWERVLGVGADLDALEAEPAQPAEGRPHRPGESRFGSLARRVFVPLLRVQGR